MIWTFDKAAKALTEIKRAQPKLIALFVEQEMRETKSKAKPTQSQREKIRDCLYELGEGTVSDISDLTGLDKKRVSAVLYSNREAFNSEKKPDVSKFRLWRNASDEGSKKAASIR